MDTSLAFNPKGCEYCGAQPATPVLIPEPTEHSTYREQSRTLCTGCKGTYMRVPYGFTLED